jgi:hypothetical protein
MRKNINNTLLSHTWFWPGLVVLIGLLLAACDKVATSPIPDLNNTGTDSILAYSGPPCSTQDVCTFKVEFWNKMTSTPCANCHDSQSGSKQAPFFVESTDVNVAYTQAKTVVDLSDPPSSRILVKIGTNHHNCGDAGACAALATVVQGYIENWANGGVAGSGGNTNVVELKPPTIHDPGTSRSFPVNANDGGTNGKSFANTVWPLLNAHCSGCHIQSAPIPQAPFFAENDVDAAYDALVKSQKINLDDPALSRLVVRLNPEFHNCWATPTTNDPTGCITSSQLMLDAITQFRDGIPLTQVDPSWVTSKAIKLTDGILASGGKRDDSSTIALYKMKTGSGKTLYDTSGVEPALNLDISGTENVDFNWVGGWGIEFTAAGAHAQGTAQNTKLRDYLAASGEYSIEAWVVPANVNQGTAGDPSRIISYSGSPSTRNFTLGQSEYRYEFMNRTDKTSANGTPSLITDAMDEDLQASQQHVVATYDPINGRKIYVNGVDVSTIGNDTGSTDDPATIGSLLNWDDSFAFILGSEAGGTQSWAGKLRLVAIHNRAMTPAQVKQNYDAGVGQRFYLMFSVSDLMDDPAAGDSNCFQSSAKTASNPRGDQCFVYMLVSQYDTYSYLFTAPKFISLNPTFTPSDTVIKGMRIGVNGKEPAVGQAYINLGKTTPLTINATDYDAANGGQTLSNIGTIIALEKGADADEFFLTFEQFGSHTDARTEFVCNPITACMTTPADGQPVSDIGLRVFNEINASMAAITGVDPTTPSVKDTYNTIEQQLPPVETIDGFVSANQMAIAQLAIQYCAALVEDSGLRNSFFGTSPIDFDTNPDVATAFTSAGKDQIVNALYDHIVGYRASGNTTELADMPSLSDVKAELIGPDPAVTGYPGNLYDRLTASCPTGCDQARTRAITKAMCTAVLGSAAMVLQ